MVFRCTGCEDVINFILPRCTLKTATATIQANVPRLGSNFVYAGENEFSGARVRMISFPFLKAVLD